MWTKRTKSPLYGSTPTTPRCNFGIGLHLLVSTVSPRTVPCKNGGILSEVISMRVADEQLAYRCPPEQRGYYELSSAIVSMAVRDYRRLKKTSHTGEITLLRKFFLSDVFENISGIENPNAFLVMLDEQIEEEIRKGVKRKREKQTMKCNG